jgi:hypothetical protein
MSDVKYGIELGVKGGQLVSAEIDRVSETHKRWSATVDEANRRADEASKKFDTMANASREAARQIDVNNAATARWTQGAIAATAAATAMAGAFVYNVKASFDAAAALQTLSDKTGIATERLAALKYAADVSDTSIDSLARAMQRLPKSMIEGRNPNSEAGRAFAFLGIDPTQLKTQEQGLDAIANAIARVQDPMAKSAALQMIFKRNGDELIAFFNQGAEGLKKLTEEGERWNKITNVSAQEAKKLKDDVVTLQRSFDGLAQSVMGSVVPALARVIEQFLELRRSGFGTGASVGLMLGTNTNDPTAQISQIDGTLAKLQQQKAGLTKPSFANSVNNFLFSDVEDTDKQIGLLQGQRQYLQIVKNQQLQDIYGPAGVSAGGAANAIKGAPNARGLGSGAGGIDAGDELIRQLQAKLNLDKESSELEKLIIELLKQKYAIIKPEQEAEARRLAILVDTKRLLRAEELASIETVKVQMADQEKRDAQIRTFNQATTQYLRDLEFETATLTMTNAEKEKAVALRELDNRFKKASVDLGAKELEQLSKTLELDKAIVVAAVEKRRTVIDMQTAEAEAAKFAERQAKEQADRINTINKEIGRSLTDALFRGFEDGKSFAVNFRDSIVNSFKTLVIRFAVEPYMTRAVSGIGGMLGAGGAAASGGGGGLGGLGSLLGGSQTMADFGNFFGSIGSVTEAGSTFGLMDAAAGFAMANPITAGLGILGAIAAGSSLFGGADHSTSGTGYRLTGNARVGSGMAGTIYGLSASDEASYMDPLADQASFGASFNRQLASAYADFQKLGGRMGIDTSRLATSSYAFDASGGMGDPTAAVTAAIAQVSDQMATELIPNLQSFQQSGESLTQTFIRLADAAKKAATSDALNKMSAVLGLKDQTDALFTGDLSPISNKQKLDLLGGQYAQTLAAAQGGDLRSIGSLSGIAQNYLSQARGYYATSDDYKSIFNSVQGDVGNLVTDTLTEQAIRFSDMGISLDQIAANTQNLDERISKSIAAALAAQGDADRVVNAAMIEAQTREIVKALIDQGYITAGGVFAPA